MALFIAGAARLARDHGARRVTMPREVVQVPRGDLIRHATPPPNLSQFSCTYRFLTQISRAISEALWCSKWVMQHIAGKLATSTFQRYKVCTNRSSEERVIAPESRGVGAIFSHFSGEDSGQTGKATGEPRVARCSWSCHLSNAPGLVDQLVVSEEDSARERGCPGGKTRQVLSAFFLTFCLCSHARLT
jgi:hypothetical protein